MRAAVLIFLILASGLAAVWALAGRAARPDLPPMVWIPGGEFTMGSDQPWAMPNERPAHRVKVKGFWMDRHDVTNDEFAEFVHATGYVTTAERTPNWEELRRQLPADAPRPPDDQLVPGSLVFVPPPREVPLDDLSGWWKWVPGANWRSPEGPASELRGRGRHPVVQVSWDDAVAYARWAGKRLPTEAEWERAARGGLEGKRYVWGDESRPRGRLLANVWQGLFPLHDTAEDGWASTSPVEAFPPNGFGLYDMAGNVWQWCGDWYRADAFVDRASAGACENPTGPASSLDPSEPFTPKRVIKGGSFLCSPSYCESYRPSARRGAAPDTGTSHTGFRCVRDG